MIAQCGSGTASPTRAIRSLSTPVAYNVAIALGWGGGGGGAALPLPSNRTRKPAGFGASPALLTQNSSVLMPWTKSFSKTKGVVARELSRVLEEEIVPVQDDVDAVIVG